MAVCEIEGCAKQSYCAGLCSVHYNRRIRTGTTDSGQRARGSLVERFWRQVDVQSQDECWPWTAKSRTTGYGAISLGGRGSPRWLAHRVAWVLTYGGMPNSEGHHGTVVRHKCNNRLCCNPAHLMIGTQTDNVADMWENTEGPRGNARLSDDQVAAIRKDPRSSRKTAPEYGVSDAHIRSIRQGRTWK